MTAACQHCRELIGGYVLDALEPAEREAVRRHIETCEPCAREHAELATLPALLNVADSADAVPLRPPARLEEAVLDRFARERRLAREPARLTAGGAPERDDAEVAPRPRRRLRPGRRPRWLMPSFAAAACALVAAIAVVAFIGGDDGGSGSAGQQQARVYSVPMSGDGPTPAAAGQAKLYPGDTGTGVHLQVSGLQPNAYDYELWCVRDDGWKISAGTFRVDANGRADVNLTTAAKPTEYDGLSIQARPSGEAADAKGVRVLAGRIKS
jgi:hypothetical protein